MSTYQDRAKYLLELFKHNVDMNRMEYDRTGVDNYDAILDQALSELASIVEEEIIGEDEYPNEHFETVLIGDRIKQFDDVVARDRLRAKQRDQLSNRSKQNG